MSARYGGYAPARLTVQVSILREELPAFRKYRSNFAIQVYFLPNFINFLRFPA